MGSEKMDVSRYEIAINKIYPRLQMFVRDVNLPESIAAKYVQGQILRERAFVDMSARVMGMVTTHRYTILSNHVENFSSSNERAAMWGLRVAKADSRFKVMDVFTHGSKTQILLLHLPDDADWTLFSNTTTNQDDTLVLTSRERFIDKCDKEAVPELVAQEWLARCAFPIGLSDDGIPFDLYANNIDASNATLPADREKRENITALSLLHAFLELRGFSPKLDDWTEERLSDNPPHLFRLRQIAAMFRAFGLPWNPSAFMQGEFIQFEHPRYAPLLSRLTEEYAKAMTVEWSKEPHGIAHKDYSHHLRGVFSTLFDYRGRVEKVLSFPSRFIAASGLYGLAVMKTEASNLEISRDIATVDDLLAELISPEGASFSIDYLARNYGYPDVDLLEIDIDWM